MGQYDEWLSQQLQLLLSNILKGENFSGTLEQVRRGIEYGEGHPGEISKIFLDLGKAMFRVANDHATAAAAGRTSTFGIPGTESIKSPAAEADLDVDELKHAIQSRKKKKVRDEMKGSLDALIDFDEE